MSNHSQNPYTWRSFYFDFILLCLHWYLCYPLSYRDLEEIKREHGLHVDHTTIYRWVQHSGPELEQRCHLHIKATTDPWRVYETYIKVKKEWVYLYRAVDSQGNTLEFFFNTTKDANAAKRFFLKIFAASHSRESRVINLDNNAAYPKASAEMKVEGHISANCKLRQFNYLNNSIEQDHPS